jgi:hypothetical protein
MAAGKSYVVIPLRYETGPDWESYSTWPVYYFEYRGKGYYVWPRYNTAAYESTKTLYPQRTEDRNRDGASLQILLPNFAYFVLPTDTQIAWYLGIMADPAQNETYDAILSQMRLIREKHQLDDNEYAELIARFVQRSVPNLEQQKIERYPIETIGDHGGGRVDKSLLLAALLAREGYAVSLIYFPNVNVIFVGIAGDHKAPEYEGYLAIDPATETFIGLDVAKAARIVRGSQYMSDYTVIPVSDGKGFTAGGQLRGIWDNWLLFTNADDPQNYAEHLSFMNRHIDDRQLIAEYLAQVGMFRSSRTTG